MDKSSNKLLGSSSSAIQFRHHHFTSIILYIESFWLIRCALILKHANVEQVLHFFQNPKQLIFLMILFITGLYHINIAFQDILKDYLPNNSLSMKLGIFKCIICCLVIISIISITKYAIGA